MPACIGRLRDVCVCVCVFLRNVAYTYISNFHSGAASVLCTQWTYLKVDTFLLQIAVTDMCAMDYVIIVASKFHFYKLHVFLRNVRIELSVSIAHVYSFLHVYVFL